MEIPPINEQYLKVKPMLAMLAQRYAQSYNQAQDDMLGEANALFVKAYRAYNRNIQTKFSTFLYRVVSNGLISYGNSNAKHVVNRVFASENQESDELVDVLDSKSANGHKLADFFASLYGDEKLLVDVAMAMFASSLQDLKKFAVTRMGFDAPRFDEAVYGIQKVMRETWQ